MKKIKLKQHFHEIRKNKDIDIRMWSRVVTFAKKNRYKLYLLLFLYLLPVILLRVPYVNVRLAPVIEYTNFIFYYVFIVVFFGFREKPLFKVSVVGFVVLCILVLLKKEMLADQLANTVFFLLITATIIAIVKNKNGSKK